MIDEHDVREMLRRRANTVPTTELDAPRATRRARRRLLANGAFALLATAAIAGATFAGIQAVRTAPVPADDRSEQLGIFAPVAGRILYENGGNDLGYDPGSWAVDPNGPADTTQGPLVADDIASTLVPFPLDPQGFDGVTPIAWSRDGTELLFKRTYEDMFPREYLYVLHADGSETQLNSEPMYFANPGATISPDGERVVFAAQADHLGLWVVDSEGGRPTPLPYPSYGLPDSPTFSPDGSQIAYLVYGDDMPGAPHEYHVWVANADGTNAHEILADDQTRFSCGGLQWSPAGDRLACTEGGSDRNGDVDAIYTFAPDGSDFTRVIDGGTSPYWSPDGTQIAFTRTAGGASSGLAIADADGSNVRAFGFAASGPWHPGASADPSEPTPIPSESFGRANGEVLSYNGGDLVAVNPETGEERVLVGNLDGVVYRARWSADGRWVAYETDAADGDRALWVAGEGHEPRLVATGGDPCCFAHLALWWMWSPTGAELATLGDATLRTIEVATGETSNLGRVVEDLLKPSGPLWAWSPDGTRLVFAAPSGAPALDSVDVRSGERSLLARLPDQDWAGTDEILWSPDGAHIAVVIGKASNEAGRLYVMDADGSNVRVVADDYDPLGVAWSPDGTRLAFADGSALDPMAWILVAPMDGAPPTEIRLPIAGCEHNYECGLTWSLDGSRIAFHNSFASTAVDADGRGEAEAIDELTYRSWAGGSYEQGA